MSAQDRLDEIQGRADEATAGPWVAGHRSSLDWLSQSPAIDNDGHEPGSAIGPADAADPLWGSLWPSRNATADAEFIASARTDVPALVAALREVLDLHKPMSMFEHEDACEDDSDEHREERHCEGSETIGEYFCLDLPTGITLCAECSRDLDFDGRDYPCPTVRAVESALGGAA